MNALTSKTKALLEASADMYEPSVEQRAKVDAAMGAALTAAIATSATIASVKGASAAGTLNATAAAGAMTGTAHAAAAGVTVSLAAKIALSVAIMGTAAGAGIAIVHETSHSMHVAASTAQTIETPRAPFIANVASARPPHDVAIVVPPAHDPVGEAPAASTAILAPVAATTAPVLHVAAPEAHVATHSAEAAEALPESVAALPPFHHRASERPAHRRGGLAPSSRRTISPRERCEGGDRDARRTRASLSERGARRGT